MKKPEKKYKAYNEFGTEKEEHVYNRACDEWEAYNKSRSISLERIEEIISDLYKNYNYKSKINVCDKTFCNWLAKSIKEEIDGRS